MKYCDIAAGSQRLFVLGVLGNSAFIKGKYPKTSSRVEEPPQISYNVSISLILAAREVL
jgi:hypothetical protein